MQTRRIEFAHVTTGNVGFLSKDEAARTWTFAIAVDDAGHQFVGKWNSKACAREILGSMGFREMLNSRFAGDGRTRSHSAAAHPSQ